MYEVHVTARSVEPFEKLLGRERVRLLERQANAIRALVGTRTIWNVNTASAGGGVAEMLHSLLRYARGLDIDVRWLVVEGPPEFFRITKRVHNALHGSKGDGSPLGPDQAAIYDHVTNENAVAMDALVRPGDLVVCHDPQTAGLALHLPKREVRVAWRCHIGHELHDEEVDRGWAFLRPYLESVPVAVFSRAAYAPKWLHKRTIVLPPNIDPFSPKNQQMSEPTIRAILANTGLVEGPAGDGCPTYVRDDGSSTRVVREADVIRSGRPPSWSAPLIVQVSRWDTMKDPIGVLRGFARFQPDAQRPADLVLAGPTVNSVADDPESAQVFADLEAIWRNLPASQRRAIHLAMLPMDDDEENAAIVNALQRHATVVVQKSLQEGFGLTVTEAMWKRRPVVASAVGGIQDQIHDGVEGLLVHNPADLAEFGNALHRVLSDGDLAERLGNAAYERVRDNYLSVSALERWAEIIRTLWV